MSKSIKIYILSFSILIALNIIVFYPSFYNCAKADHTVYLVETAEIENLTELVNYSFSYARTRVLNMSADRIMFRPFLMSLLSFEKWLWGYNFVSWQITGFFLHLIVLGLMLRLFHIIQPHFISNIFILFFSVLYIGCDMVTWHHVHGYLVFLIFVLLTLINLILYIQSAQQDSKKLWLMALFLCGACFTVEFGVILSFIIMLALLGHRKFVLKSLFIDPKTKKRPSLVNSPLILIIPPVSYLYLSILDYTLRFSGGQLAHQAVSLSFLTHSGKFLAHSFFLLCASFILPFSPGFFMIFPSGKNYVIFSSILNVMHNRVIVFLNIAMFVLILTMLAFLAYSFVKERQKLRVKLLDASKRKHLQTPLFMIFLGTVILFAYIFVFTAFRPSKEYISSNLYHFYVLALFTTILGYCTFLLIDNILNGKQRIFRLIVLVILCFGISLNGIKTYHLSQKGREIFSPWGTYIRELEKFVKVHRSEKDFSFYSLNRDDSKWIRIKMGNPSGASELRGYTSDYLFRKYINNTSPKYYLIYTRKDGIISFEKKDQAEEFLQLRAERS